MDGNFLLKLFKNLNCLGCNSPFCIKGCLLKGSKCPVLLKCGHSLCDSCIKLSNTVTCPQCQVSHAIDSNSISEQFSYNFYLMGTLIALQFEKQEKERKRAMLTMGDANFNYSVKRKQQNVSNDALCEECSMRACWSCENCQSYFCDPCWTKVHGAAKSLMKHVKLPVRVVESIKIEYQKCPIHEMQDLELFCKTCKKSVCSHCFIQKHQGGEHCLITMKEKNLEMVSQLKTVAEEAEVIFKRMKHTLEKIKFTQDSPDIPNNQLHSRLRTQIMRNFARLHGVLQLQEEKILKKIYDKSNEREDTLKNLSAQLENQIQKTEFLLEKFDSFVQKPEACDLNILYEQLCEVKTLPCYLISQKCDTTESIITFDENVVDMFENYCTLELPSNEVFQLRSGSDLPEDFAVEPLSLTNCDQRNTFLISGSNSDIDTVSNCSSKEFCDSNEVPKFYSAKKSFYEGRKYSVHITYIKNPGEFYVTLNSQRKVKENIEKRIESYNYPFIIPSMISKDELHLVKYKVDGKWYRARIVEVLPEKGGEIRAVVNYIDYGNTDTVSGSWVKPLPSDLTAEPPLAIKCKLLDCVPKNGKWSQDSVKLMEKIVSGLTATLFVMKIQPDCLEVDLSIIYPDGQIGRDIVSVRDALIFLECACFVGGNKIQENPPAVKYEEQILPSVEESFDVVITHVNSPDDFYLHRTKQDGMYLCKLGAEIQKYYNENPQKGIIYNPAIGMPCAAKFSADRKWYRAVIKDLPGRKMVTVFYVDYGNMEVLPWMEIRKLRENFVKRPPLAINCSLAKIEPKISGNWDARAKAFLEKCILTKGIRVQVDSKHKTQQKLQVLMYKQGDRREVCVNSLFTDMGFTATPASEDESTESFGQGRNKEKQERKEKCRVNHTDQFRTRDGAARKTKLSAKELRQNYESEKRQFDETPGTEDDSCSSETAESNDSIFKVKVEVLSAESPSAVYVTFPKANDDFQNLQSALNDFYEDTSPPEDKEWVEDSKCVVYYTEKKCWCRAIVSKASGDEKVKVFLKDFAFTITVPASSLRELDQSFTKFGPRAIKCHLADVVPPGDIWPGISCEFLAGEIENSTELYMTKKGEIENNSLPIELWVHKLQPASALEPSNVEWITLNKLLVDKGLAVPKQKLLYLQMLSKEKEAESICEKENEEDEEEEEEEPIAEATTFVPSLSSHWLPPDPLRKSKFVGIATYVDHDGYIYIQDDEDEQKLAEVRYSLKEEYENSKASAEDHFWSVGQMCVVRYFADSNWYRGKIIEISEMGNYQVLFVDYGNTERCKVSDLRKRVKMIEIPTLVHKFKLYGVAPIPRNGKWPIAVIEVLHSLVVDEKCEVNVLRQQLDSGEPHLAMLKILTTNLDVAAVLIQERLGVQHFIDSESLESFDGHNTSFEDETNYVPPEPVGYASLEISEDCTGLNVLVKALRSENGFYGHIVESENLPVNLRNTLKEFRKLEEILAEECHLQPKLENITEGTPCCCVHSGINKWCRGQIETVTESCVCIYYVDYGYKEFLTTDLVHECKPAWLKVPKMAVKFHIPKMEKCANVSKAAYMKALTSCLMETKFWAEILERREDYLEVELLKEKDGELSYQQLVDEELIKTT